MRYSPFVSLLFFIGLSLPVFAMDMDHKLGLVMKVYHLKPKRCDSSKSFTGSVKERAAGEMLFKSTSLSGNRDISCSSCHLEQFGTADGLQIAVGVGGHGAGHDRLSSEDGTLVQRNTLPLSGRGDISFTAFFWDGKVQVEEGRIISQFGDAIKGKFQSPLAVAATLPIIERDEFMGRTGIMIENDIQKAVDNKLYYKRYLAVGNALRQRFLIPENADDHRIAQGLKEAGVILSDFELADVGNLLAVFIRDQFRCEDSAWDRYLSGNTDALTKEQKKGAILFYGKGRCASCHSGSYFSDFDYHSIGAPQGAFGPHSRHRDIGRAAVTHRVEDLYTFRTPPLTSVNKTSPYGHNGAFDTLKEIVVHHFNPLAFYITYDDYYSVDFYSIGKILASRDLMLSGIDIHTSDELSAILQFLEAL